MTVPSSPGEVLQLRRRACCQRTSKSFDMIFQQCGRKRDSGRPQWWLRWAETSAPQPSAAEVVPRPKWLARLVERSQPAPRGGPRFDGHFYVGTDYRGCPYCQSRGFFMCAACDTLNCSASGQGSYVVCGACREGTQITGELSSMTGELETPRPRRALPAPPTWFLDH